MRGDRRRVGVGGRVRGLGVGCLGVWIGGVEVW
jgi:hypothetical protein